MTSATFIVNHEGKYIGFKIEGHSGYAPIGEDIVCAGISTIGQAAIIGIEEIAKVKCISSIVPETAKLSLVVMDRALDKLDKAELMIKTAKVIIENIHEQYPDHVQIETVEANVL